MNFISKFTKRDFGFAILTGLITGTIGGRIFEFLKTPEFYNLPWASLVVAVPILWILGVLLGYFLGQWLDFFNQFGKFAAIGFTNFAVTAGVLNILLSITNYASGIGYAFIYSASFVVGVISSYVWNKYWAFRLPDAERPRAEVADGVEPKGPVSASQQKGNFGSGAVGTGTVEFVKFFTVTIVAFIVSLIVASLVVNYIHPLAGMNAHQWANIGTVAGSAVGLIFSFVGFKIAVFRR